MGGVGGFRVCPLRPGKFAGQGAGRIPAGFLGLDSLGRSTLAQIVETNEKDRRAVIEMLAAQLVKYFGAPDLATASLAAEEEIGFVASLCDHSPDVLVAVTRSHENGTIREQFRTLRSRGGAEHTNAFEFFEVVGDDEVPAEHLDLAGLEKGAHR